MEPALLVRTLQLLGPGAATAQWLAVAAAWRPTRRLHCPRALYQCYTQHAQQVPSPPQDLLVCVVVGMGGGVFVHAMCSYYIVYSTVKCIIKNIVKVRALI